MNPHSTVAVMSKSSMLLAGAKSEAYVSAIGLDPRIT